MPSRRLPDTDAGLIAAMTAARTKAAATAPAQHLISAAQLADLNSNTGIRARLEKEVGEAGAALANQVRLSEELEPTYQRLKQLINHFFIVFDLAVERGFYDASDRAFYLRDANAASIPPVTTYADAELWGQRIVTGEVGRAGDGALNNDVPMSHPAAEDVSQALTAFRGARSTYPSGKDRYDDEQADIVAPRTEAANFVRKLWNTIEFNLQDEPDAPSLRRRAREWGVIYALRPDEPDEPEEPEEPAAPASTTPPPTPG